MNMSLIDGAIVAVVMIFITIVALKTQKYVKGVADFCSANRCAGRYLLGIARSEVGFAAVSAVAYFEIFYKAGFAPDFWGYATIPIGLVITLSGFVTYRYRATRALTLAQFLEMRYSRKFRIFAGTICWISGILNFGIFPGVAARFFINFCGLPPEIPLFGVSVETFPVVMFVLVSMALSFTLFGGQIAILVTDFWQGTFALIVFALIIAFLWFQFPWSQICETMKIASLPGESLINPLDIGRQEDFNIFFYLILMFIAVYTVGSFQGASGYNSSAINPHEAKMANVISSLRGGMITLGLMLIPIAALVYMNHPEYTAEAANVQQSVEQTYPQDHVLQRQMLAPFVLGRILPIGMVGAFVAAMLGFFISTNNTYMHSWGTIFVQDIVCPLRKKPLSTQSHIRLLRWSIVFVGLFAYLFSWIFPLKEYIQLFLTITGTIFMGGAGAVIIGGLYWKRGTTAAAYSAMIVGSVLATSSIILRLVWEHIPLLASWSPEMPVNSQIATFFSAFTAVLTYVLVTLLRKKQVANMDKLLHRGEYAIKDETDELRGVGAEKKTGKFWRFIGVNNREFSKTDKGWFLFTFLNAMYRMAAFFILLCLVSLGLMNDDRWLVWWRIVIFVALGTGAIIGAGVSIGGFFDLAKMYRKLKAEKVDESDDGRVMEHVSAADAEENKQVEH
jgi:SSS family solute:Na+ symporter